MPRARHGPRRVRLNALPLLRFDGVFRGDNSGMGIGVALILIAVGAILIWAVKAAVTIGWILLVVGIVGIVLSLIFWSSWGGFGGRRRTTVVEE